MSIQDEISIIREAIKYEDNGLSTYLEFARKTENQIGKNMFIRLAMDEHQHRLYLEDQLVSLLNDGKWKKIEIPKSEMELIAPAIREKQKQTKGESGLSEIDALNTAIDFEKKSAEFFREQAESATEPDIKAFFLRLAEWEDAHFDLIQAELDAINQTGFWFGIPEFRMDGKF